MSITVIAFAAWAFVAVVFLIGTIKKEAVFQSLGLYQVGDTSLGRNSVNWMALLSFSGAVAICCLLT